jgi:hypothetical protein
LIDMMTGRVQKSVSTIVTDDRANFSGVFWGIKNGSDTITVTNGVSASFLVSVNWLARRM